MITRRRFVGLAGAAALLALSGCATPVMNPRDDAIPEPEPKDTANTAENEQIAKGGDAMTGPALIAYFSCTGTTERIAGIIEEATGADMFWIVPQQSYTEADLAYYTGGRADQEQNDPSARPAIAGRIEDLADYDTIILGYPIWHGQAPRIIDTFLESYDFAGKTVLPFCTSHSSGLGSSASDLHALTPEAHWLEGCKFQDQGGIFIGDRCLIGHNVIIATLNHHMDVERRGGMVPKSVRLGDDVWMGSGAILLPGVSSSSSSGVSSIALFELPCCVTPPFFFFRLCMQNSY